MQPHTVTTTFPTTFPTPFRREFPHPEAAARYAALLARLLPAAAITIDPPPIEPTPDPAAEQ